LGLSAVKEEGLTRQVIGQVRSLGNQHPKKMVVIWRKGELRGYFHEKNERAGQIPRETYKAGSLKDGQDTIEGP